MKAYAKNLLQEEYEVQAKNRSQVSPKVKQPSAPQQRRLSQSSPRQSGMPPGSGQPPQSAQRLSMSPAPSVSSAPSPRVKSTPPGLYHVVSQSVFGTFLC